MSQGKNITKKQHYIPQAYLRGFSPEYLKKEKSVMPHEKYTIYCHDLTREKQIQKPIPIKSVCYSNFLYEVTGHDGEIVLPNHLEKFFSFMEKMFSEYRYKLENKVFIKDNYKTKSFLKSEEKAFWVTYILIQLLRMPQILQAVAETSLEILGSEINEKQAKNIARMFCLPFFKEIELDDRETNIFYSLLEPMMTMSFGIGVDRRGCIITSDKPVYICSREFPCREYEKIVFPISSQICLFLFGGDEKKIYRKNFLFPIDEGVKEEILKSITYSSFGKLYSNHSLNRQELRYINEVIKDREEDGIGFACQSPIYTRGKEK